MQYMNFMFVDINKSKFYTLKFKMAAVFKMAAKMASKILKISWISYFSIYLGMQYVNSVLNHKIQNFELKNSKWLPK